MRSRRTPTHSAAPDMPLGILPVLKDRWSSQARAGLLQSRPMFRFLKRVVGMADAYTTGRAHEEAYKKAELATMIYLDRHYAVGPEFCTCLWSYLLCTQPTKVTLRLDVPSSLANCDATNFHSPSRFCNTSRYR